MFDNNSHAENNLSKCSNLWENGLFVTELMGQGVNIITGDYSGAFQVFGYKMGRYHFQFTK